MLAITFGLGQGATSFHFLMFGIPDQAVGAVIAAIIAGSIALLGLIISKEQKVSEFRQQWIDALRQDIAPLYGMDIPCLVECAFRKAGGRLGMISGKISQV
jgi:hypothetical protein